MALVTLTRYPSRCDAVIAASWLSSVHSSDAGSSCVEASVLAQPLIFQYYKANSEHLLTAQQHVDQKDLLRQDAAAACVRGLTLELSLEVFQHFALFNGADLILKPNQTSKDKRCLKAHRLWNPLKLIWEAEMR